MEENIISIGMIVALAKDVEIAKLKSDLDNALIPAQAEGESIHVEDSSEYDAKLSIVGNSKQETRERSKSKSRVSK